MELAGNAEELRKALERAHFDVEKFLQKGVADKCYKRALVKTWPECFNDGDDERLTLHVMIEKVNYFVLFGSGRVRVNKREQLLISAARGAALCSL